MEINENAELVEIDGILNFSSSERILRSIRDEIKRAGIDNYVELLSDDTLCIEYNGRDNDNWIEEFFTASHQF